MPQTRMRTTHFELSLIALTISLMAVSAWTQTPGESTKSASDTVFTDIRLAPDGVTAVDVDGIRWHYDFERLTFVIGAPAGTPGQPGSESPEYEGEVIPIEERAIEKKALKNIEQTVLVGYDEYVDGNIIALDRVVVKGWVKGSITSYRKRVLVTESGRVDGDIKAPSVVVKEGGVVLGTISEEISPLDFEEIASEFSPAGIIVVFSFTAALLVLAFASVLVFPRQYGNLYYCQRFYAGRSFAIGLVTTLLSPVAMVVVALTIVGIFAIPLIPLGIVLASLLGVVGFGQVIGRKLSEKFLSGERSTAFSVVLGTLLFMWPWIAASALMTSSDGGFAYGFGIFLLVVSIVVTCYPVMTGVGAAVLTRFGFRPYQTSRKAPRGSIPSDTPAPPPIPKAPPAVSVPTFHYSSGEPPVFPRGSGPLTQPGTGSATPPPPNRTKDKDSSADG